MASPAALTKRSASTALMPPPPLPTKRQKRPLKVLEEDTYASAISHIITRDFFPGILESRAQAQYLEALESNDKDWIREAGRGLVGAMTPGREGSRRRSRRGTGFENTATPRGYVGSTPVRTPMTEAGEDHFAPEASSEDNVDVDMSLGAFQAKFTSEDNESFNALLDKQNQKRAGKYAFFQQGNKIPSARQIAYRAHGQKLLEGRLSEDSEGSGSTALITTNAAEGTIRYLNTSGGPSQNLDDRPASVEGFRNRQGPRNDFMFYPEGIEDALPTDAQAAETRSNAPPRAVTYGATRFSNPNTSGSEDTIPPSPSMSAIDAAIAGRPPKPTESEPGYSGAETPRVNGYAFVDADPTPTELGVPVSDEEADAAEREAALRFLPAAHESGPNPFMLRERSKREDTLSRLVEKTDAGRRRERGGGGRLEQFRAAGVVSGRTPTPEFASGPKVGAGTGRDQMTPAARRLAERIGTPTRDTEGFGIIDDHKRRMWTPTPRVRKVI